VFLSSGHSFKIFRLNICYLPCCVGHAVAQLVEALPYKPKGREFEYVIGIFHSHNPSARTVALGSTQPLTGRFPGGKAGQCGGLKTLPPSCADCLETGKRILLEPSGSVQDSTGIALPRPCRTNTSCTSQSRCDQHVELYLLRGRYKLSGVLLRNFPKTAVTFSKENMF
jgi:hypothetical protein